MQKFVLQQTEFDWRIETQQGEITFKSVGFQQIVRQLPVLLAQQSIGLDARKGISFSREPVTIA